MSYALDLSEIEAAALLSLVGLAVSVMQNDEESGRGHIEALSLPGMEPVAKAIVEKCALLFTPNDPAPTLILDA